MLWSKVKTSFIIIFLVLDIAFLVLMGITSAGSGLSADEVAEIMTLCDRYGITLSEELIPTQTTRLPMLEARFLTPEDLPEGVRSAFTFDGEGRFVYHGTEELPQDEKAARRLITDTLKAWGFDSALFSVEGTGGEGVRVCFTYQSRPLYDCTIDFTRSEDGTLLAQGRWLWDVTVTQGAETILDAPTVLAELVEEESLCHQGLSVTGIEIGYFPESVGDGVVHKIFPISPAYRIRLSNGETRIYSALSE